MDADINMASGKSSAYEHFVLDENGSFKCGVAGDDGKACGKVVSQKKGGSGSTPAFNMKRHLKRYHETVFRRVMDADAPPTKNARAAQAAVSGRKSQQSLNRYFETSKAVVTERYQGRLQGCTSEHGGRRLIAFCILRFFRWVKKSLNPLPRN